MGPNNDFLDAAQIAPLVQRLDDPVPEVRIAGFEALARLPLQARTWKQVITYGMGALVTPRSPGERLTVIGAAPALPVSELHERVAALTGDADERVRTHAAEAMSRIATSQASLAQAGESPLRPRWAGGEPPGFAFDVDLEQARATVDGIVAADDTGGEWEYPFFRLRRATRTSAGPVAPAAVTLLFDHAAQSFDILLGNEIVQWVHELQGSFRPDLEGLFAIYRRQAAALLLEWPDLFLRFFESGLELFHRWLCWQLGWTVSRGGLQGLVPALTEHLTAADAEERMTAALLIADAADYSTESQAPGFGGGFGPERRMNVSVLPPAAGEPALDDDVQFSVYRPRIVRPERWYPLLVFVHRTTAFEDADGRVIDPVASVERQAAALLADQAAPFTPVRTDSPPLQRGTELRLQPWLDGGDINPPWAPIRWEEPIHRVEFRIKAPASADGSSLRGGVRVFRSGLLIAEIGFYVSVNASAPVEAPATDRLAMKRYRKVFASYSHRDADVVQLVADYVESTGDQYLIDVRNLRSGEEWEKRLEELIADADIFQLFWSRNSMASVHVQREWEHALGLGREEFIRPVYWEVPMPADQARGLPPESLQRLQFAQLPLGRAEVPPGPVGDSSQAQAQAQQRPAPPASFPRVDRLPPSPPARPYPTSPPPERLEARTAPWRTARERRSRSPIGLALVAVLVCALIALLVVALR